MKNQSVYFETLGAAFESFLEYVKAAGGELVETDFTLAFVGGVSYGQTRSEHYELASLKGKKTRKFAHVTLYRLESGRYELTNYLA